jgi:antitoxin MazE
MKVKVAKWGNSLGVRLPSAAAEMVGVKAGSELDLTVEQGSIMLRGMTKTAAQRLQELLDQIDPNNIPETIEWGPDRGSEIIDDDYSRGLLVEGPDGVPVRAVEISPKRQTGKGNARSGRG